MFHACDILAILEVEAMRNSAGSRLKGPGRRAVPGGVFRAAKNPSPSVASGDGTGWLQTCSAPFIPPKKRKAGLSSGLRGDKVLTPSPRRSEGPCDQLGVLSEPHGEQNLYANPKRTANFSINNLFSKQSR